MESLADLLIRTIAEGAPLYNKGDKQACFELYFDAAKWACMQEKITASAVGQLLEQATDEAMPLGDAENYDEGAWVLRRCFNDILNQQQQERDSSAIQLLEKDDVEEADGYWQDEAAQNTTNEEKSQALAEIYSILLSSLTPASHMRYTKTYENCFPATIVVETLLTLGLAVHRKMATQKANMLIQASLLKSVSHETEASFSDGTHLYRFPNRDEMETKLEELNTGSVADEEGSGAATIYMLALQSLLEGPVINQKAHLCLSAKTLPEQVEDMATASPEQVEGVQLAKWAALMESVVDVSDRKHNFRTYEKCFVGSAAITAVVESDDLPPSYRTDARILLNKLLQVGILHHVTRDHEIEDKKLFYRFATPKELQTLSEAMVLFNGPDLVRNTALVERLHQFAGLDIAEILNSFYGCGENGGPECWDKVDLQTWRNNMKRWGFGRREAQDDAMVDKLSLVLAGVDPQTWEPPSEEWWSPWGILAQIAIFDQVSRSAFRGTSEAFHWDVLAIKATKVAIERGYFETAYKSTLNQFVILLPLEHSESWEDQKLGVSQLLQLLSKVAIQDEGLSEYEIVKRLEFSKRLATAFLEHAQVVAKFKRYPHRNKAHGRNTSLEERIWLASDLVPRWAKSQQHPESADGTGRPAGRNLIQLPVIPLKRLTRG